MILEVENLRVELPIRGRRTPLLRGLDFHLERGEILGVAGESGSGKSLTSLAIMGLLPPSATVTTRRFRACGVDLSRAGTREWGPLRGREMSMIFQNPFTSINPSLTLGCQMAEAIRKARPGSRRAQTRRRAGELLGRVGLESPDQLLKGYVHQLSGGMAQRVAIALALACEPRVLIADEPTTALDASTRNDILDLIADLRESFGMAVMLISHDIGLITDHADRLQIMYSGEIVESGPVTSVVQDPAHPYTRGLMEAVPGYRAIEPKHVLQTIPGIAEPVTSDLPGCRFAPRCAGAMAMCSLEPATPAIRHGSKVMVRCHMEKLDETDRTRS